MNDEKVHFWHIILYEFRKGITVGTAVKNIREIYQDRASSIKTVKKWFSKFRQRF